MADTTQTDSNGGSGVRVVKGWRDGPYNRLMDPLPYQNTSNPAGAAVTVAASATAPSSASTHQATAGTSPTTTNANGAAGAAAAASNSSDGKLKLLRRSWAHTRTSVRRALEEANGESEYGNSAEVRIKAPMIHEEELVALPFEPPNIWQYVLEIVGGTWELVLYVLVMLLAIMLETNVRYFRAGSDYDRWWVVLYKVVVVCYPAGIMVVQFMLLCEYVVRKYVFFRLLSLGIMVQAERRPPHRSWFFLFFVAVWAILNAWAWWGLITWWGRNGKTGPERLSFAVFGVVNVVAFHLLMYYYRLMDQQKRFLKPVQAYLLPEMILVSELVVKREMWRALRAATLGFCWPGPARFDVEWVRRQGVRLPRSYGGAAEAAEAVASALADAALSDGGSDDADDPLAQAAAARSSSSSSNEGSCGGAATAGPAEAPAPKEGMERTSSGLAAARSAAAATAIGASSAAVAAATADDRVGEAPPPASVKSVASLRDSAVVGSGAAAPPAAVAVDGAAPGGAVAVTVAAGAAAAAALAAGAMAAQDKADEDKPAVTAAAVAAAASADATEDAAVVSEGAAVTAAASADTAVATTAAAAAIQDDEKQGAKTEIAAADSSISPVINAAAEPSGTGPSTGRSAAAPGADPVASATATVAAAGAAAAAVIASDSGKTQEDAASHATLLSYRSARSEITDGAAGASGTLPALAKSPSGGGQSGADVAPVISPSGPVAEGVTPDAMAAAASCDGDGAAKPAKVSGGGSSSGADAEAATAPQPAEMNRNPVMAAGAAAGRATWGCCRRCCVCCFRCCCCLCICTARLFDSRYNTSGMFALPTAFVTALACRKVWPFRRDVPFLRALMAAVFLSSLVVAGAVVFGGWLVARNQPICQYGLDSCADCLIYEEEYVQYDKVCPDGGYDIMKAWPDPDYFDPLCPGGRSWFTNGVWSNNSTEVQAQVGDYQNITGKALINGYLAGIMSYYAYSDSFEGLERGFEGQFIKRFKGLFTEYGLMRYEFVYLDDTAIADTQFIIAGTGNDVYMIFRGTDSLADALVTDLASRCIENSDYGEQACVHRGFLSAYRQAQVEVYKGLLAVINGLSSVRPLGNATKASWDPSQGQPFSLWLTGHSLGGALATLCAIDLRHKGLNISGIFTYGSPRVGDTRFRNLYGKYGLDKATWRYVHRSDAIPQVPPQSFGFVHVTSPYMVQDGRCTVWPDEDTCAATGFLGGCKVSASDHYIPGYLSSLRSCVAASRQLPNCTQAMMPLWSQMGSVAG